MGDRVYRIEISGFDLTEAEAEALFERVAEAAHALDEQVVCSSGFKPS